MRSKKTLINSAYSLGAYIILFLLTLATRRLFVTNFDENLLGYAGVIENIFGLLAVTEMGVGSVITYHLYQELGEGSRERVSLYMSLYRKAYQCIGFVISVFAVVLLPFLPLVFRDGATDWRAVYVIYCLQVANTLSTYFLSFRRILYTTEQRGYICTRIDLAGNLFVIFSRLAIAAWWPNYFAYYGVTTLAAIACNLAVAVRYRRDYPDIVNRRVTWQDFKDLGMLHDVKTYIVHRLSNALYGSVDNIVISSLLGTAVVSRMTNYSTISTKITDLYNKVLDGFAAGIGNLVYDKEARSRSEKIFWGLDLFSYFIASFTAVAYLCLLQPFIHVWMPNDSWLLPMSYVVFFSLNEYVGWNHRMLGSFRGVLGKFELDMGFMVASALTNVVLSFVLVWQFGLGGVVAATVAAHCLMWFGRVRVVFGEYLPGLLGAYVRKQLLRTAVLAGEMLAAAALCSQINARFTAFGGLAALVLDGCVAMVLPNAVNAVLFLPTSDAVWLREKAAGMLGAVRARFQKGE